MKKVKLALAGTAILMSVLLLVAQRTNSNGVVEKQSVDVRQYDNSEEEIPVLTLGIPVNLY